MSIVPVSLASAQCQGRSSTLTCRWPTRGKMLSAAGPNAGTMCTFSARYWIRTTPTSQIQAHEDGLPLRTVVVDFDSYEIAVAARESETYQQALRALGYGAERDVRIVEGA